MKSQIGMEFIAKSLVPGLPDLVVVFIGKQEWGKRTDFPPIALYNLTTDLPLHPKDSTVSRQTIEQHGYALQNEAP
jgi:hypothetical protein